MSSHSIRGLAASLVLAVLGTAGLAADKPKTVYPVAVLPFQERGVEVKGYGGKVTDILFADLVADSKLFLVEREGLENVLDELKLGRTGLVKSDTAVRVGQLTGAKLLITGSVIQIDQTIYIAAKIIGTETSRVLGASVKGKADDALSPLIEELAGEIGQIIRKRAGELVAQVQTREDRVISLNKRIPAKNLPVVQVNIDERHVGQTGLDPAAQTELTFLLTQTGFKVVDPKQADHSKPDVLLLGEGISEFAGRIGELVSVKARLEVKAVDARTQEVLAVDRQVSVQVDLTEQIAGKAALQKAAAAIAERMLPGLVRAKDRKQRKGQK